MQTTTAGEEHALRSNRLWYSTICVVVVSACLVVCAAATVLGRRRRNDASYYFYELSDIGHPGMVNMITAMGFLTAAVVFGVIGLLTAPGSPSRPAWLLGACLFTVVAFDDVLRLHNQVPAGDVLSRAIYWVMLVGLGVRLRRIVRRTQGFGLLVMAFAFLAISEFIDIFTPGDERTFAHHELFAVVEETAACVGAWSLALAGIGFALSVLVVAPEPAISRSGELPPT